MIVTMNLLIDTANEDKALDVMKRVEAILREHRGLRHEDGPEIVDVAYEYEGDLAAAAIPDELQDAICNDTYSPGDAFKSGLLLAPGPDYVLMPNPSVSCTGVTSSTWITLKPGAADHGEASARLMAFDDGHFEAQLSARGEEDLLPQSSCELDSVSVIDEAA